MKQFDQINKTHIAQAVAISASLIFAPGVQASVFEWGVHSDFESAQRTVALGIFTDTFTFTLPAFSTITSVAVSNNLGALSNLPGGRVQLYQGVYGDAVADVSLMLFAFSGATGSTEHTVSSTPAGSYYYQISGFPTGSFGGQYQLASAMRPLGEVNPSGRDDDNSGPSTPLSPVPEPETYAMLLAGLGIIGAIGRRRQRG